MEKEIRYIATELRANKESRTIEGYAILFDSQSENLGGFVEVIERGAVTPELIAKSDIKLLYNHNEMQGVLARSKRGKGTLNISIDDKGVKFSAEMPNTSLGSDVLESIRLGNLDACSFAFNLNEGNDSWEKLGSIYKRTIKNFNELFDFSVVVTPAYSATAVSARSLDKIKELEAQELLQIDEQAEAQERQAKQAEEMQKDKEFNNYYNKLVNQYLH